MKILDLTNVIVATKDEIEVMEDSENKFFLDQIAWNDYGWTTNYMLYYESLENKIGRVKIVESETVRDSNGIDDMFNTPKYYMIGDSSKVYENLEEIVRDEVIRDNFLSGMGDLTNNPSLYEEISSQEKGKDLLSNSFFRYPRTRVMFTFYKLFKRYTEEDEKENWCDLNLKVIEELVTNSRLDEIFEVAKDPDKLYREDLDNLKGE